jgi:hypothetical protein
MNPVFCLIQLLFYYPFFFFLLYIYLIFFIPFKNTVNITKFFSFFSTYIKKIWILLKNNWKTINFFLFYLFKVKKKKRIK